MRLNTGETDQKYSTRVSYGTCRADLVMLLCSSKRTLKSDKTGYLRTKFVHLRRMRHTLLCQ